MTQVNSLSPEKISIPVVTAVERPPSRSAPSRWTSVTRPSSSARPRITPGRPVRRVVHEDDPVTRRRRAPRATCAPTRHVVRLVARRDDQGEKHPAGAPPSRPAGRRPPLCLHSRSRLAYRPVPPKHGLDSCRPTPLEVERVQQDDRTRARVRVSGRVQGVFFRDSTREKARELGLSGYVKNTPDGDVEALFEGPIGGRRGDGPVVRTGPPARLRRERRRRLRTGQATT